MKRETIILSGIIMLLSFVNTAAYSQQRCIHCGGTGNVDYAHTKASGFGQSPVYINCPQCGAKINANNGKTHKHKCPSCKGTGRVRTRSSSGSQEANIGLLNPDEYFQVEKLAKQLFAGVPEFKPCQTCRGTGKCQSPGLHHYGNMSSLLDLDGPTPQYCPLCGGWGTCSNSKCVNGQVMVYRSLTQSEKNQINKQIQAIYDNAYKRECGR